MKPSQRGTEIRSMEQILSELPCEGSLPLLVSIWLMFACGKAGVEMNLLVNSLLTLLYVKYKKCAGVMNRK